MNAQQFAEFWRLQGYRVISTRSADWYTPHAFSALSIPYHRWIAPARLEVARVFVSAPAIVLRFPSAPDGAGKEGGIFLCADRAYDFHNLQPRTRTMTRRGLEHCAIERADFDYLAEHGHALNVQTFLRQGRSANSMTEQQWRAYCRAAGKLPDFAAWCAWVNGRLAAFMVTAMIEEYQSILHASSATDYLPSYPNHALVFTVTQQSLSRAQADCVSYGLKSLDDTAGLNRFKAHMGFTLKPFKENLIVHPLLQPFFLLGGQQLVDWMARRYPQSDLWRKASKALALASAK